MREYKFRAWDKEENRFWYFKLQETLERQMSYKGSWDEKILRGKKQQYTGLEDKNGKEIYEGDIVKHEAWAGSASLRDDIIGPVVFKNGCFAIKTKYGDKYLYTGFNEVIGNIYENPKLLENK